MDLKSLILIEFGIRHGLCCMANYTQAQLVNAKGLTELLFEKDSRPSVRTVREWQKKRLIPFIKLGGLVLFNPDDVSSAINGRFRIIAKTGKATT